VKTLHEHRLDTVTVGIRPEHLTLNSADGEGISAVVDLVEDMGSESFVYTHIDAGDQTLSLAARALGRVRTKGSDTVTLHHGDGPVHFFDPVTGDRIDTDPR
jgi:multiple sugar transport system ATP-binding protein